LAEAILRVAARRADYVKPRGEIERRFSTGRTIDAYERLFERLRGAAS
jgi:hypothetical protein